MVFEVTKETRGAPVSQSFFLFNVFNETGTFLPQDIHCCESVKSFTVCYVNSGKVPSIKKLSKTDDLRPSKPIPDVKQGAAMAPWMQSVGAAPLTPPYQQPGHSRHVQGPIHQPGKSRPQSHSAPVRPQTSSCFLGSSFLVCKIKKCWTS